MTGNVGVREKKCVNMEIYYTFYTHLMFESEQKIIKMFHLQLSFSSSRYHIRRLSGLMYRKKVINTRYKWDEIFLCVNEIGFYDGEE